MKNGINIAALFNELGDNQEQLQSLKKHGVLALRINRPKQRNPLSLSVLNALRKVLEAQARHDDIKLVIITGAGDKSFAAGGDLKELMTVRSREAAIDMSDQARHALDSIRRFPVPVVAAINGDALGGGLELAMACDFRIMSSTARLAFLQGRLNLSTGWGGGTDSLNKLPLSTALELMCSREMLDGERAMQLGLCNRVAADSDDLMNTVSEFAAAMLQQTGAVMRSFKAMAIAKARGDSREQMLALETELFADNWIHEDHWEAVDRVFTKGQR